LAECGSLLRSFHCPGTACTLILLLMANGPVQPESDLDPTDPYARKAQTFPRLSEEMAARVVAYGTEERLPKGTSSSAASEAWTSSSCSRAISRSSTSMRTAGPTS
jgi:hypothetical protein